MWRFNFSKSELPKFDSATSEYEIADFVDQAEQLKKPSASLASLLDERKSFYQGRGSNEVFRIQGYVMAALELHGLVDTALPIVFETLESSMNIYMIAAAARAVRGMEQPNSKVIPFLLAAINNVYYRDDTVAFDCYTPTWPLTNATTALKEIFFTFQWLAPVAKEAVPKLEEWLKTNALNQSDKDLLITTIGIINSAQQKQEDCCDLPMQAPMRAGNISRKELLNIKLQDQDGQALTYGTFFRNQPSVLVFFYTRCDNHNKCSLTINKLGKLQKIIQEKGLSEKIKTAAISYDPAFDGPKQLKLYGLQRHQEFDERNRNFSLLDYEQMPKLLNYFSSSVNYFGRLVNKHQIELYLIDQDGYPVKKFVRLQWDPLVVVEELERHLNRAQHKWKVFLQRMGTMIGSTFITLLIAFFPKCPFCWAAYLSLLGVAGLSSIPYSPWLLPLLCIFLATHVWFLWRRAAKRKQWSPFWVTLIGIGMLIVSGPILQMKELMFFGMSFMVCGSLLNSMPAGQKFIHTKIENTV